MWPIYHQAYYHNEFDSHFSDTKMYCKFRDLKLEKFIHHSDTFLLYHCMVMPMQKVTACKDVLYIILRYHLHVVF